MNDLIKLSFLGDCMYDNIMAQGSRYYKNDNGVYDFTQVFKPLKSILQDSDYVFMDLETPISHDFDNKEISRYMFCAPYEFAKAVKEMGVDFVATANNHCMDMGAEGLDDTVSCLNEVGLQYTGISDSRSIPKVINISGIKCGIISYTYGTNAFHNHYYLKHNERYKVALLQEQELWLERYNIFDKGVNKLSTHNILRRGYYRIKRVITLPYNRNKKIYEKRTFDYLRRRALHRDIEFLRDNADVIVAYIHVGGQFNELPSSYTKKIHNELKNLGVNIIISDHEHVIHGLKVLIEDNYIGTYAMGNLLGSMGTREKPYDRLGDYSVMLNVFLDKRKEISTATYIILKTIYNQKTNQFEVWPAYDLYHTDATIKKNMMQAATIFSGKQIEYIAREYPLM